MNYREDETNSTALENTEKELNNRMLLTRLKNEDLQPSKAVTMGTINNQRFIVIFIKDCKTVIILWYTVLPLC